MEGVDAFIDDIRDTFLGLREAPLTCEQVRNKQFFLTQLRPGYDQEDVNAFLDEVEARLPIICAECGESTVGAAPFCVRCGAPVRGQRPPPANPPAIGTGHDVQAAPAAPKDAWSPPAWVRRGRGYFLAALVFCLVVYMIGVVGLNKTPQGSGLHQLMLPIAVLGLAGALVSLILAETARNQFRPRQVVWALVPVVSLGLLSFVPFLWLALIRRRASEWVVCAAYLAAVAAQFYFDVVGYPGSVAWSNGVVIEAGLVVIAPIHAVVAFSPAAGASSWRDAHAARTASKHQQPVEDAVAAQDGQQDIGPGHSKPIPAD